MFLEPPLHGFHAQQTSTIAAASPSALQAGPERIDTHPHSHAAAAAAMHDGRNSKRGTVRRASPILGRFGGFFAEYQDIEAKQTRCQRRRDYVPALEWAPGVGQFHAAALTGLGGCSSSKRLGLRYPRRVYRIERLPGHQRPGWGARSYSRGEIAGAGEHRIGTGRQRRRWRRRSPRQSPYRCAGVAGIEGRVGRKRAHTGLSPAALRTPSRANSGRFRGFARLIFPTGMASKSARIYPGFQSTFARLRR